jgi:hypothetical protein
MGWEAAEGKMKGGENDSVFFLERQVREGVNRFSVG